MFKKLYKRIALLLLDIGAIQLSFVISFYLRFEKNLFSSPDMHKYLIIYVQTIIVITLIKIFILWFFKMYDTLWSYATVTEFSQIVIASSVATAFFIVYFILDEHRFPRSIYVLTFVFDTILFSITRLGYRMYRSKNIKLATFTKKRNLKRIMIVGGGIAGSNVIREIRANEDLNSVPVCVIDDNLHKKGKMINGVPIMGARESIAEVAKTKKIDQIIIAIPSADNKAIRGIVREATKTNCELKIIPGMYELIDGSFEMSGRIRNVEIADLLGRDEIELSIDEMKSYIFNKVILVSGAGGSIGSELCRQIAKFAPEKIIILDIYENNAFLLQNELKITHPNVKTEIVIASVRDKKRIFSIISEYKPFVIFHAAAHKHVPLMESSPQEAVKNNVFGSYYIMEAAKEYGVDRFILISSDKAVNPTSVMGATKRITEILVKSYNECTKTKFVAVRFGNVLDSNGSVIPTFKAQIEAGGPLTVTHKDITRYFMTIPEAVSLVIQASSFGRNGEIFVLDMGEPIRIVDLAENLIKLSGFTPYKDIQIEFIGLRPGEKMFEELILDTDKCLKTVFEKIFIEKQDDTLNKKEVDIMLKDFEEAIEKDIDIRKVLTKYIPTYKF